jgi:hypothetical protein
VGSRIPSIALSGSTGSNYTAGWTPWNNEANDYQIRDDVSWTKGAHQFKIGFSWMLYKKVQSYFTNTQGNFTFNGSFTGNDFADYLLGYAQQYTENAIQASGRWNNVNYSLYAQDTWRATNRLTLNYGLRWDGMPHTYEANHQSATSIPICTIRLWHRPGIWRAISAAELPIQVARRRAPVSERAQAPSWLEFPSTPMELELAA